MSYKNYKKELTFDIDGHEAKITITLSRFYNVKAWFNWRGYSFDIQPRISIKTGNIIYSEYDFEKQKSKVATFRDCKIPENKRLEVYNALEEMKSISKRLRQKNAP